MTDRKPDFNEIFDIREETVDGRTSFRSAMARHLYDWWAGRGAGGLPRRKEFDIVDHRAIVANIFVVDCLPDGNFVFRLFGEEVIAIIGRNRTGETLVRGGVGIYGHALFDYYTAIVRTKQCMKCLGSLKLAGRSVVRFESIDCPLTDDGTNVMTRTLNGYTALTPR